MNTGEKIKDTDFALVESLVQGVGEILRGKEEKIRLVLSAFFASGHILIEDVPGVGKTTLVRALAKVLGTQMSRIQFTADLLPTDIMGVQAWESETRSFVFRRGPIFAELVLADEINRASPKTQSALLEAMAEKQVSVDDATFSLPELFTVIATQNPVEHHGTYPLPESQLDRFMIRLDLGYLQEALEKELLLTSKKPLEHLSEISERVSGEKLLEIREMTRHVHMDESIVDYLMSLVHETRAHSDLALGCSTRGAMDFAAMARAYAFVCGREYVLVDDIKVLGPLVLSHRLVLAQPRMDATDRQRCIEIVAEVFRETPVPR
jgi:MoxR-like ATPase